MVIKKINGVSVVIIGLDKCNGYLSVYYTLNRYMFLDWVKKDLVVWEKRVKQSTSSSTSSKAQKLAS